MKAIGSQIRQRAVRGSGQLGFTPSLREMHVPVDVGIDSFSEIHVEVITPLEMKGKNEYSPRMNNCLAGNAGDWALSTP